MIGALVHYLQTASSDNFQPMNANYGLLQSGAELTIKDKKKKRLLQAEMALSTWKEQLRLSKLTSSEC
jgi:methylenetetrahydrofolate--tRNA-(uracil-5-)-methyltransferase